MRQLKSIAVAVGQTGSLADSSELHGIPCSIKVKIEPATTGTDGKHYDAKNVIRGFDPLTSAPSLATQQAAATSAASASQAQQQAKPPATVNTPKQMPWERKPTQN